MTITGLDSFDYVGESVYTAANGDELYLSEVGTGTFTPECLTNEPGCETLIIIDQTITGGTGRFEGASGTLAAVSRGVLTDSDVTTSTFDADSTLEGTISY